jgi:hypothetical protein
MRSFEKMRPPDVIEAEGRAEVRRFNGLVTKFSLCECDMQ